MRIVHYHPRALVGDGGITNSVGRLSEAFVALGASAVIAYDGTQPPPVDTAVEWVPVAHRGSDPLRLPYLMDGALRGADLLVLNSAWTPHNARAGAIARKLGVPYVLAPRGAYDPALLQRRRIVKRAWWTLFEGPLIRRARALHAFFPSERAHLAALGHDGDVLIAPNGVVVPPTVRWDGGSGGYLLYMGRFDPEHKGLDLLVRAVAVLPPDQRPVLRLHGPDWRGGKATVQALVAALHLGHWVTVERPIYGEEKWLTISRARGFVYPSRWEGFGNSLAEASALGVPCLATPYPLARYLADRQAAVLAEATVTGLVQGLCTLCLPETAAVGQRAAQLMAEQFTWDAVARSWLEQAKALV